MKIINKMHYYKIICYKIKNKDMHNYNKIQTIQNYHYNSRYNKIKIKTKKFSNGNKNIKILKFFVKKKDHIKMMLMVKMKIY